MVSPTSLYLEKRPKAVLHDFYSQRKADLDTEIMKMVETAAKLIMVDIKAVKTSHKVYYQ